MLEAEDQATKGYQGVVDPRHRASLARGGSPWRGKDRAPSCWSGRKGGNPRSGHLHIGLPVRLRGAGARVGPRNLDTGVGELGLICAAAAAELGAGLNLGAAASAVHSRDGVLLGAHCSPPDDEMLLPITAPQRVENAVSAVIWPGRLAANICHGARA
jgi:hypothetical protein